jgi:hypothetical protein
LIPIKELVLVSSLLAFFLVRQTFETPIRAWSNYFIPRNFYTPVESILNIPTRNMFFQKALLASTLAFCAISAPLPEFDKPQSSTLSVAQQLKAPTPPPPGTLTAEKLIQIAPATASCSGGDFAAECANATRATAAINKAFSTFKITEKGEKAALVAYMLFESGNFKYNRNHFPAPGRPGQGTRMMA